MKIFEKTWRFFFMFPPPQLWGAHFSPKWFCRGEVNSIHFPWPIPVGRIKSEDVKVTLEEMQETLDDSKFFHAMRPKDFF